MPSNEADPGPRGGGRASASGRTHVRGDDGVLRWLGPAIGVIAAVAYGLTCARHVLGGDNGEFATLFGTGGVAHPTGYPAYVLWLRAFAWLPASSPAHGAALATAVLGAGTVLVLFAACRAHGASRGAAAAVVAAEAFSAPMWIASTHAEVFALEALLAAAILWGVATDRVSGARRAALLAALAGLGLANHVSIVLLAPIGLFGFVRGVRESTARARTVALGALAFAVGLLPYAYLVIAARAPGDRTIWGAPVDLAGLAHHVLRVDYGTTTLALGAHRTDRLGQELLLARSLIVGLLGLPLIALASPLVGPRGGAEGRLRQGLLLLSFLLVGPFFVGLFNLSADGLDRRIVERFHLLPLIVASVLVAPALDRALGRRLARPIVAVGLACAALLGSIALTLEPLRVHHLPDVERYAVDTLSAAPPRAIVLGTGDHRLGAFLYARRALGLRPDVTYLDPNLALTPWYRAQLGRELGVTLIAPKDGHLSTPALAAQLLATGRPVLLANTFTDAIPRAFPTYPIGTLERIVATPAEVPDPVTLEQMNRAAFAGMHPSTEPPPPGTWGADLRPAYARPWRALAAAFHAAGNDPHAAELDAIARSF
jgi:hypothetical protein